jgi:sugar phosphate isomerase/epimerase
MYKIKQSMDAVNYGGYFHEGGPLTMKEIIDKAAEFGYDAVDIWPHKPLMFPMDWSKKERKELLEYAKGKNIKFAAIDACTNFMRSQHVLVADIEKELPYLKECCELAADMECLVVRILPAFIGYFWSEYSNLGYCQTALTARSMEVSKQEDYYLEWNHVRDGIIAAAEMAKEYPVILALQGHPPVVNCVKDLFDMVEEVGMDNVKLGVDLPLFDHQTEEFITETIKKAGKNMAHSHTLGVAIKYGPSDSVYATEEVVPGDGVENWIPFFKACKEVGYEGYFAYEQCAPFFLKGHKKPQVKDIDERQQRGFAFIKGIENKI